MAFRKIVEWYFGEEDKEEIKKYSKEISILFKIKAYNPEIDDFCDFFNIEDFDFIPCIKKWYDETEDEEFDENVIKALNSAYDSSVKVRLDDLVKYANANANANANTNINVASVRYLLLNTMEYKSMDNVDFVNFIESCNDEIVQKFINWLYN